LFKKTMRFSKVLSVMLLAGFSTAAQADLLYQCAADQGLWTDYEICTQNCYRPKWVTDYSHPDGGYWTEDWYGCFDYYTPPNGGGGGSSGGGGGPGNGGTGGEQQSN
jgi:hypothetical protein